MHLNFILSRTVCFLSARQIEFRRKIALVRREYPEILTSLLLNPAMSILSGNFKLNLLLVLCAFYSCFVFTKHLFPLSLLSFTSLKSNPNRRITHKAMVLICRSAPLFTLYFVRALFVRPRAYIFFFVWRGSITLFVFSLIF